MTSKGELVGTLESLYEAGTFIIFRGQQPGLQPLKTARRLERWGAGTPHSFNSSIEDGKSQAGLWELEASLGYTVTSSQGCIVSLCLKKRLFIYLLVCEPNKNTAGNSAIKCLRGQGSLGHLGFHGRALLGQPRQMAWFRLNNVSSVCMNRPFSTKWSFLICLPG